MERVHVSLSASGQKFWDATYDLHGGTKLSPELVLPSGKPFHPPLPGDPPKVTLIGSRSPVPKMFPLCAPDHGHYRYQLHIQGERYQPLDVKTLWPIYPGKAGHSTVTPVPEEKTHYSVCGKNNLAELCPFMKQGGIANFEKHMLKQIEPRIDAVVHRVVIEPNRPEPLHEPHVATLGPHFGKVHLPRPYQEAIDRLDHTRRPAMKTNPFGIPMYELRSGPHEAKHILDHRHAHHDRDQDAVDFPKSFRDVAKRRDNWEEIRVSALHNGKMGLFDARHPPKNLEAVDREAYSETYPLYDRNRMPPELRHPAHDYEGFHDHIGILHPSIEFRHWVHYAKVKLVDLDTHETLWDKVYEVHGHKVAADQRDIGGPVEFKGLDPRLGKLDMFKLTVDADSPHISPEFGTRPTSHLNDVHQREIRGLTNRLDHYIANPPQSRSSPSTLKHTSHGSIYPRTGVNSARMFDYWRKQDFLFGAARPVVQGSASIAVVDPVPGGHAEATMLQPQPVHKTGSLLWKAE